jgi:hypothetical protein
MITEPQPATSAAGPAAGLMTSDDPVSTVGPVTRPPGARAKGIVYGMLWLAIPLAVLVVWVMAAASADPTGGCGGG